MGVNGVMSWVRLPPRGSRSILVVEEMLMQTDSIEDHKWDSNPQSKDEFLYAARLIPMG